MKLFRFESTRILALSAVAAAALVGLASKSEAANVNVSGSICTEFNTPAAQSTDIVILLNRVRNTGVTNRDVVCAVPRSPATQVVPNSGIIIYGDNPAPHATSCTVSVQSAIGTVVLRSGITFEAKYSLRIPLSSSELPFEAFIAVHCALPPGGVLRGITVVQ